MLYQLSRRNCNYPISFLQRAYLYRPKTKQQSAFETFTPINAHQPKPFCKNKLLCQFKMESIQALCTLGNTELLATKSCKLACLTTDPKETTSSLPPVDCFPLKIIWKMYTHIMGVYNYSMLQPVWYLVLQIQSCFWPLHWASLEVVQTQYFWSDFL